MPDDVKRGLEGVLVAETELSCIDGEAGDLSYCGYSIEDLARNASYEEVVYLLWHGELPDAHTLEQFSESMISAREVASDVRELIKQLAVADEDPMAALRTIVSTLSAYDTDSDDQASEGKTNIEMAKRITAKIPTAIAAFHRFSEQKSCIEPRDDLGHAANFLYMLNGHKPNQTLADTFDMALVLHADHGLNASTFSAKVTASTLADLHSAMTAAVGTLSGSLHGGANTNVMRMLIEMDESDKDPREWVENVLDEGGRVPGFGHRVYDVKDHRAAILGERSKQLAEVAGDTRWYDCSVAVEEYISETKGLAPNVDFYSASTYYQMGIPIDIYTPIFAMSRAAGWIAHVMEQHENGRLIRPRSRYVGPDNREISTHGQ